MKNLITSIACLMVLLAILVEFTHSQVLCSRVMAADQAVNCFRDAARAEGCVSDRNAAWVQRELSDILQCSREDIEVSGPGQPVSRGELIAYSIKAPVGDALAMPGFWDIGEEKNRFDYQVSGYVTSAWAAAGGGAGEGGEAP